jgi:hypothetical protein
MSPKFLLRFYLANLEFKGIIAAKTSAGSWKRDSTQVKIGARNIKIAQVDSYDDIINALKSTNGQSVTAFLEFECGQDRVKHAIKFVNNLCFLMSFATGSKVNWVAYDAILGGAVVYSFHSHNLLHRFIPFPVIPDSWPANLRFENFLEKSYPLYRQWKARLKINQVIEYQLLAKQESVSDVAVLFASVAMESLKHHYKKWKRLPRKNPATKRKWTFEEILRMCFADFGMRRKNFGFIKLRNQVVHSGQLTGSFRKSSLPHYLKLLNIIDRLVLKMLGYKGTYINVVTRAEIPFRN